MLKKLPKNKSDIKFINAETMQVECTYNQCFKKFVESDRYVIETTEDYDYNPIKYKSYFHKCTECERLYANRDDKTKTYEDFLNQRFSTPKLTLEETEQVLKQLKRIYEKTKKEQVAKVFNEYNEYYNEYKRSIL